MHFCTAYVAIGGDTDQSVYRSEFSPISWPEVQVLQMVHGEDAVDQIRPFVDVAQTVKDERVRLREIYGGIVDECWPGRSPNIKMNAPKAKLDSGTQWRNPITRQIEETTGKKAEEVKDVEEPEDDDEAEAGDNPGLFDSDFGEPDKSAAKKATKK